jgi:tetratricopeptide (TPR) repeat protein
MWYDNKEGELEKIDQQIPDHLKAKNCLINDKENHKNLNSTNVSETKSGINTISEKVKIHQNILKSITQEKEQANDEYKNSKFEAAIGIYAKMVQTIEENNLLLAQSDLDQKNIFEMYIAALSNSVQAYINLKNYDMAILIGKKAISVDKNHIKSYFRIAKAFKYLN